jgi:5'-methylthioadenosine phosphorylase
MIGVFGGSGFYELLTEAREVRIDTPYGEPAALLMVGTVEGVEVAFMPRHGRSHELPPHRVPYRANVWAMKQAGAACVIGPCAAGSLDKDLGPGTFVVCDQLVDRTSGRDATFFDGPEVQHLSFADPYCEELRTHALAALAEVGAPARDGGTVVVIQGPRFSTRAESAFYAAQGWQVINMTQAPEAALVRELGMCYVNISVITDYDVGVEGVAEPVTHDEVLRQFARSVDTLRDVIRSLVPRAAGSTECGAGAR